MARPTREQLSKLSFAELKEVLNDVQSLIKDAEVKVRNEAKQALLERAKELGFELNDLFGNAVAPATKGKGRGNAANAPAKYRHPENHDLTWTGRGRRPSWIAEYESNGGNKEDFLIDA